MRAPFDRTCTVWYGHYSPYGPPDTVRMVGVPCRQVFQDEIVQLQQPFNLSNSWLTVDMLELNGPYSVSPGIYQVNTHYAMGDYLNFLDHDVTYYGVMRKELVYVPGHVPYWRYLLLSGPDLAGPGWPPAVPLPPPYSPPPVVVPGTTCALAPVINFNTPITGNSVSLTSNWYACVSVPMGPVTVSLLSGPSTTLIHVYNGACPGGLFSLGFASITTPLVFMNTGLSNTIWLEWNAVVGISTSIEVSV